MTRRLLNLLTGGSLLLCVAVSVLWVRSRSVGDYITFTTRNGDGTRETVWDFGSGRGRVCLGARTFVWPAPESPGSAPSKSTEWKVQSTVPVIDPASDFGREEVHWEDFGVIRQSTVDITGLRVGWYSVLFPLWLPLCLFTLLPAIRLSRHLKRRGKVNTLCPTCGYDLRATPDRCPECGVISASVSAA